MTAEEDVLDSGEKERNVFNAEDREQNMNTTVLKLMRYLNP